MAVFIRGRPITTQVPTISVDPGMTIGLHRFELVVVDSAGLRSRPDVAVVRIAAGVAGPVGPVVRPIRRRDRNQRSER